GDFQFLKSGSDEPCIQPIESSHLVDRIELVSEADIEHAIVVLLEIEKTVVEGAGAAGLAALLLEKSRGNTYFKGKRIGLVLTGGNIDPLMLGELIERGMVRAGRLARIRVDLRDLPGALAHATRLIADVHANITEVHHQRAFTALPVRNVEVDFVLQTRGPEHIAQVISVLNDAGFAASNHDH
ncbi:ACT domain protein, partial [Bordetella holmesii H620]